MLSFKQKIHIAFTHLQEEKIKSLKNSIADLSYSISNETKSTAGDKHETALAHLQTAVAQANQQLQELTNQYTELSVSDPTKSSTDITAGSLVITNHNYLYISAAIGKVMVDDIQVHAISARSPVAIKMMGLKKGGKILVNEMMYEIMEVL